MILNKLEEEIHGCINEESTKDRCYAFVELMNKNMQRMYKVAKAYMKYDSDVADVIKDAILTCYEKIGALIQGIFS
ncbi:hypothetical protein CG709_04310, partial [Lachnotalea glycerini]